MYINVKKVLSVVILLAVGAFIGISIYKTIENNKAPKQTVAVVGSGEIDATTDQANVTIQIKTISTTYEKAQTENKKDVDVMKSDLKKLGIPESRITISSYSQPVFNGAEPMDNLVGSVDSKMQIIRPTNSSPTVTTDLNLTIDPIKNIDKIFDLVSKNSNAQVTNTYYSLKDRKSWESKAKVEALKDIRSQVESIAKINHLKVGKLLNLDDGNTPRVYPMDLKVMRGTSDGADSQSYPVTSEATVPNSNNYYSEQSVKITSSYTATYELY